MRFPWYRAALALAAAILVLVLPVSSAAAQASGWKPGPGAVSGDTYIGFIDSPTAGAVVPGSGPFLVRGWFVDTTAQGWAGADNVQVWSGPMGGGGQLIAQAQYGQSRPDVGLATGNSAWSQSGFNASVPGSAIPGGPQLVYVYVHTPGNGWWYMTVPVNGGGTPSTVTAASGAPQIQILQPTEGENISQSQRQFTVSGTVSDPANTTVEVWIDGERDSTGGAELGTATPASDGSWSLDINPSQLRTDHHNLRAYALDRATALQGSTIVGFNITNH
jgi:hypothetical protein